MAFIGGYEMTDFDKLASLLLDRVEARTMSMLLGQADMPRGVVDFAADLMDSRHYRAELKTAIAAECKSLVHACAMDLVRLPNGQSEEMRIEIARRVHMSLAAHVEGMRV